MMYQGGSLVLRTDSLSIEDSVLIPDNDEKSLDRPIRVHSNPILTRLLPYSNHTSELDEDIYPKSSNYWYSRMVAGKSHATGWRGYWRNQPGKI